MHNVRMTTPPELGADHVDLELRMQQALGPDSFHSVINSGPALVPRYRLFSLAVHAAHAGAEIDDVLRPSRLRREASRPPSASLIEASLAYHVKDLRSFAGQAIHRAQEIVWPNRLPYPPRRKVQLHGRSFLLPEVPQGIEIPDTMLPPDWGEIRDWYHEQYRLSYQIEPHELGLAEAPTGRRRSGTQYTAPDLIEPVGRPLLQGLVQLDGIPKIEDIMGLERHPLLNGYPYLCIVDDRYIRTLKQDEPIIELRGHEVALLNILMIRQLGTGRGVSEDQLQMRTGISKNALASRIHDLFIKLSTKGRPRTMTSTGRRHWGLSDNAIIVDARLPVSEGDDPPQAEASVQ